ncbi:hypothetical protein LUZ60_004514 [Juncus effusus]|nr:hypothetical protein LUZ60_004514 [Juncus effusus]
MTTSSSSSSSCPHMEFIQAQPWWALIPAILGLLSLLKFSILLLHWIYITFLRPGKPLRRRYGQWAVVTGCTDGIGRAFSFQLARRYGMNLVLVGRNAEKLQNIAEEIKAKSPKSEIETVVIDFSGDLVEGVERLEKTIRGLDVGLLINSAGVSYPYARYFHEVDDELLKNLIKINVEGVTRVTHAILPGMVERKRGAIVNIGSGAATVIPSDPLYTVYAATKAYVDQFSRCLAVEYKSKGIDVQCQVPLYVATKMASVRKSSLLIPSPETYARSGLRHVGYEYTCTPYWAHSAIWCLASALPQSLIDTWRIGFNLKIRKRGQAKDARKKDQ